MTGLLTVQYFTFSLSNISCLWLLIIFNPSDPRTIINKHRTIISKLLSRQNQASSLLFKKFRMRSWKLSKTLTSFPFAFYIRSIRKYQYLLAIVRGNSWALSSHTTLREQLRFAKNLTNLNVSWGLFADSNCRGTTLIHRLNSFIITKQINYHKNLLLICNPIAIN